MKRSEINALIRGAIEFVDEMNFKLPPFAYWTAEDWKTKDHEYDEIRDNMLGWDITDFGGGDYEKVGLLLFTVRNGNFSDPKYTKPYAEKILISDPGQVTPYHFHFKKMEDIINRGGGTLVVKLYNSSPDGASFLDTPVTVYLDGRCFQVPAGTELRLTPGESITLPSGCYHSFWGEGSRVLIGEVSKVNDDRVDNRFYEKVGRFPAIEEDVPAEFLLSMDYPNFGDVEVK